MPESNGKPEPKIKDFDKLRERVKASYDALEPFREVRLEGLKQYVGSEYGSNDFGAGADHDFETLVNLLELMVNIYLQQLVSANPSALVTTQKKSLKVSTRYFEIALNHVIRLIDLKLSLRQAITEAMFSMGVMKVGVTPVESAEMLGELHDPFLPFCDPVYFNEFVFDTTVEQWERVGFVGNRYRMLKEDVLADTRNDPKALLDLNEDSPAMDNPLAGTEPSDLSGNRSVFQEQESEYVTLWDVYMPRENVMVTYHANGTKPLRIMEWKGPEGGPYHILRFNHVLNNIMPLPPVVNLLGLGDLFNKLWCKCGEQASRQKTLTFAQMASEDDAKRVRSANDGDIVPVMNPQGVTQARYGGVEQATVGFAAAVRDLFSYLAGNLDTLGGLAAGAGTLGQEELMAKSSSNRIRSMQMEVFAFVESILWDTGWYLWNDPMVKLHILVPIQGTDVEIETTWPQQPDLMGVEQDLREGEYDDLNLSISPFSMQDQPPGMRLMQLRQIFQQDVLPILPMMQQLGMTWKFDEYFKAIAKLGNLPEMEDMIEMGVAQEQSEPGAEPVQPLKPPTTTRTYERARGGGMSRAGADRAMAAAIPKNNSSGVNKA